MNTIWYGLRLPVVAAVAALALGGCGASTDSTGSAQSAVAPAAAGAASAASDAGGAGAPMRRPGVVSESGTKDSESFAKPTDQIVAAPQDRAIIYTAEMTVRAKDVSVAADRAKQIVLGAKGLVAEERATSFQKNSNALITFKIPAAGYQTVLTQLGSELGKRESLHQNTEDVTEQVADVDSRVKSATAALDQFRTLLTKAKTIGEVLEVEREIANREAELESQQARQKSLASQTSMATLTLTIIGPSAAKPKPKNDNPSGFLEGLSTGWKAMVSAVKTGLTVLGVLLPWIVVLAVLWLIGRVVLRRSRRPTAPPPIPVSAAAPDPTPDPAPEGAKAEAGSKG